MDTGFLDSSQGIEQHTPLAGDAGNRLYSRIKYQGSSKNYILCKYPSPNSEQLNNFIDIYKLLKTHSINTPNLIEHSETQMLLEDLGDLSLEDSFKANESPYSKALDQLIRIQKIPIRGSSKAQSYSFTIEKFVWEMNFTLEHFSKFFKFNLDKKITESLQKNFTDLCTHLYNLEQVITHRDLHSRNIMMHDQNAFIIDFQDARIGPKFYDLVSLIEDSYTNLNPNLKEILITEYCSKNKIQKDSDFMKNYHLQNIQRSFKACGSFVSFKNRTNNERYLQYLKPAFKSLINSCQLTDGYNDLKNFIKKSSDKWDLYAK